MSSHEPFRILSLDGGGVRGIFAAKILTEIEAELQSRGDPKWQIYHHFDLICGTSTGGIIALGLSIGIPAQALLDLYLKHAKTIFGHPRFLPLRLFNAKHENTGLEKVLKDTFKEFFGENQPTLKDCNTYVCIPAYNLSLGATKIFKKPHNDSYHGDKDIPLYQVALATSAGPIYFDPYDGDYTDSSGIHQQFSNYIDGGVIANNPTLVGIVEALGEFEKDVDDLRILSIGNGTQHFSEPSNRNGWSLAYWGWNARIIDVFLQGQSQNTDNLVSILLRSHKSKSDHGHHGFAYKRLNVSIPHGMGFKMMDETDPQKLNMLAEMAGDVYNSNSNDMEIIDAFFTERRHQNVNPFT